MRGGGWSLFRRAQAIYAQNAIREKNSGLNYLRMSARIDAVAQRPDTVVKNQAMQKSIVKVNKGLSVALKSMNVEKISKEMDAFEKQFEDIDEGLAHGGRDGQHDGLGDAGRPGRCAH